jgi:hypothetical protein
VAYVQSGTEALQDAKQLQKKTRKWMCCGIITLLVVAAVIVIVVVKPWTLAAPAGGNSGRRLMAWEAAAAGQQWRQWQQPQEEQQQQRPQQQWLAHSSGLEGAAAVAREQLEAVSAQLGALWDTATSSSRSQQGRVISSGMMQQQASGVHRALRLMGTASAR